MKRINLVGEHFGKLLVESYAGTFSGKATWNCKCQCGNRTKAITFNLRKGITTSCGNCPPILVEKNLGIRPRSWQSLLGPELTEQFIKEAHQRKTA